jgi:hypothetical protein
VNLGTAAAAVAGLLLLACRAEGRVRLTCMLLSGRCLPSTSFGGNECAKLELLGVNNCVAERRDLRAEVWSEQYEHCARFELSVCSVRVGAVEQLAEQLIACHRHYQHGLQQGSCVT